MSCKNRRGNYSIANSLTGGRADYLNVVCALLSKTNLAAAPRGSPRDEPLLGIRARPEPVLSVPVIWSDAFLGEEGQDLNAGEVLYIDSWW